MSPTVTTGSTTSLTHDPWPGWVQSYSVTASSSATDTLVWRTWVNDSTNCTCASATGNEVWVRWVTNDATASSGATLTTPTTNNAWYGWVNANVQTLERAAGRYESWRQRVEALMTPEERERQEREQRERQEAARIEREQKMKVREAAIFKAEKLLRSCLTAKQEASLNKHGYFEVRGGSTGTRYRIRRGRHINIEVVGSRGKAERKLCFAPRVDCPDADAMLCQKLMLELDEDAALKIANKHSVHTGIQHGYGDQVVPQQRREEIIAEVIPIARARRRAA